MQKTRVGTNPETRVALETWRRIIAGQEAGEEAGQIAIVPAHERECAVGTQPQAASAVVDDLGSRRAVGTAVGNTAVVVVAFPARVVRHVGTDRAPVERRWWCGTTVVVQAVLQGPGLRVRVHDGAPHRRELVHLVHAARQDPDPTRRALDTHPAGKVAVRGMAVLPLDVSFPVPAIDDRHVDRPKPKDAIDHAIAPVACDLIVFSQRLKIELDRMSQPSRKDKSLRLWAFWLRSPLDYTRCWRRRFGAG